MNIQKSRTSYVSRTFVMVGVTAAFFLAVLGTMFYYMVYESDREFEKVFHPSAKEVEQMERRWPDDPNTHLQVGFALYDNGRYAEAIRHFEVAKSKTNLSDHTGGYASIWLGKCLFRLGEFERARAVWRNVESSASGGSWYAPDEIAHRLLKACVSNDKTLTHLDSP